jgi:hypothetical protein
MARARLVGSSEPAIAQGVALHHATDDVFHGAPLFLRMYTEGITSLERSGVGRGTARAVAHVGTELLLDGLLLERSEIDDLYLEAIALAEHAEIAWRDGGERFASLHARLAGHGLPIEYRAPDRVAIRLGQALSRRPRLAIAETDSAPVLEWLEGARVSLAPELDALLGEVRHGLASHPSLR